MLENYLYLRSDEILKFKKEDMVVFLICDGFERIPESFKNYASEKNFLDLELLKEKGFLK